MHKTLSASLAIAALALASQLYAAPCEISTNASVVCPKNNVCVTVSGVPSDLKGWELSIDTTVFPLIPPTQLQYNYAVPLGTTLPTTAVWSATAVAKDGQRSAPYFCTQPFAVTVPNAPPAAITGFKVVGGAK